MKILFTPTLILVLLFTISTQTFARNKTTARIYEECGYPQPERSCMNRVMREIQTGIKLLPAERIPDDAIIEIVKIDPRAGFDLTPDELFKIKSLLDFKLYPVCEYKFSTYEGLSQCTIDIFGTILIQIAEDRKANAKQNVEVNTYGPEDEPDTYNIVEDTLSPVSNNTESHTIMILVYILIGISIFYKLFNLVLKKEEE
jgi:hypothetical protein